MKSKNLIPALLVLSTVGGALTQAAPPTKPATQCSVPQDPYVQLRGSARGLLKLIGMELKDAESSDLTEFFNTINDTPDKDDFKDENALKTAKRRHPILQRAALRAIADMGLSEIIGAKLTSPKDAVLRFDQASALDAVAKIQDATHQAFALSRLENAVGRELNEPMPNPNEGAYEYALRLRPLHEKKYQMSKQLISSLVGLKNPNLDLNSPESKEAVLQVLEQATDDDFRAAYKSTSEVRNVASSPSSLGLGIQWKNQWTTLNPTPTLSEDLKEFLTVGATNETDYDFEDLMPETFKRCEANFEAGNRFQDASADFTVQLSRLKNTTAAATLGMTTPSMATGEFSTCAATFEVSHTLWSQGKRSLRIFTNAGAEVERQSSFTGEAGLGFHW